MGTPASPPGTASNGRTMDRERFEALVEEALADLPPRVKAHRQNIAVLVEARPPRGSRLLGLYHGVPFKYRGPEYGNVAPEVIVIYQWPIDRICSSDAEIRDEGRLTVLHEGGHYFGLDEKTLRDIEEDMRGRGRRG